MYQLNTFVLASTALLACAISHVEGIVDSNIDVSPTALSGRRSFGVRSSSYLPTGAVLEVSDACQLNFSYVSDQPVSVWFSLEGYAQTLLVLPDGRPCVNKTTCTASAFIDRHKQYVLLAEYLPEVSGSSANVVLNFSAAVPSASGSLSSALAHASLHSLSVQQLLTLRYKPQGVFLLQSFSEIFNISCRLWDCWSWICCTSE